MGVPAPRGGVVVAAAVAVLVAAVVAGGALRTPSVAALATPTPKPASTPTLGPDEQPGPRTVRFAAGVDDHPRRQDVQALLQGHFDAINLGDYQRWTTTVVAERAAGTSEQAWREQYRSTIDGNIRVLHLEPRPGGGLLVMLTFTSVQDPVDAPPDASADCLNWRVTYSVVTEADQLRIGLMEPETSLREPC